MVKLPSLPALGLTSVSRLAGVQVLDRSRFKRYVHPWLQQDLGSWFPNDLRSRFQHYLRSCFPHFARMPRFGFTIGMALGLGVSLQLHGAEDSPPLVDRESTEVEDPLESLDFESCILHEREGGLLALGSFHPLSPAQASGDALGASYSTWALRLAPKLMAELSPLVARLAPGVLPRSRDGRTPVFIIHLQAKGRRLETHAFLRSSPPEVEIAEARVVHVEALRPEWISAWEDLSRALRQVVDASLSAPSGEKRRRLAGAIEDGCRALSRMSLAASPDEAAEIDRILSLVEPKPRRVGSFRRQVLLDWGGALRAISGRLRVEPVTPLGSEVSPPTLYAILAESATGADFAAKARESSDPSILDDSFGSYPLGRELHAWEVESLSSEEFAKLREVAVGEVARSNRSRESEADPQRAHDLAAWGVAVEAADSEVLAEALVLSGVRVSRELPTGSRVGLRAGDLLLTYASLADLSLPSLRGGRDWMNMGWTAVSSLGIRAASGGTGGPLKAIRGAELVEITADGPSADIGFASPVYLEESHGSIWIIEPLVYLGMVGVRGDAPVYRLGAEPARALRSLVTRTVESGAADLGPPDRYAFGFPRSEGGLVLVQFEGRARLAGVSWRSPQETHELVSVTISSVEFLPPLWTKGFDALDEALREKVLVSLEAPGEAKRSRLAAALRRGADALEAMDRAGPTEDMVADVRRIEPRARIVRSTARRIAREWGGRLADCGEALGLELPGSFARVRESCPALELLVESRSSEDFHSKLRARCGEDGLQERLFYSEESKRTVSAWETEGLTAERFEAWRQVAAKALEERRASEEARKRTEPEAWDLPAWGVRLRRADAALRRKLLVIRGAEVEAVLPGGPSVGLRVGDVLTVYEGVYDLVMGGADVGAERRATEALAHRGGKLRVLRDGRAITVDLPRS